MIHFISVFMEESNSHVLILWVPGTPAYLAGHPAETIP